MNNFNYKSHSLYIFLILSYLSGFSQKLPNRQEVSLRTPLNIKVDGKATEWNNQFQAYNHATNIFYTIANDDENIYLIICAKDPDVLTKITTNGIIFNINANKKADNEQTISINYPYFEKHNKPYINFKNPPSIIIGSAPSLAKADSIMKINNRKLDNKSKYIKTKGLIGLDTLISIYNEDGIKVKEGFDNAMAYICEMAIPLKYLSLSLNNSTTFNYHIILTGITSDDFGIKITTSANGSFNISAASEAGAAIPSKSHLAATYATTDFWGKYTLAKKP